MLFPTKKKKHRLPLDYREMLEESVSDLRSTMCELQERLHSVDGEGEVTFYIYIYSMIYIYSLTHDVS